MHEEKFIFARHTALWQNAIVSLRAIPEHLKALYRRAQLTNSEEELMGLIDEITETANSAQTILHAVEPANTKPI